MPSSVAKQTQSPGASTDVSGIDPHNVAGKVQASADAVHAAAWITRGSKKIDLTNRNAKVPSGTYTLHWELRGNVGQEITVTVTSAKQQVSTSSLSIPAGKVRIDSGRHQPSGYKPIQIEV